MTNTWCRYVAELDRIDNRLRNGQCNRREHDIAVSELRRGYLIVTSI